MAVKIECSGRVVIAYLDGEIDHHSAFELRTSIDAAIKDNAPEMLVLDFKNITFMDSSGIGLVMGRYRALAGTGAEIHITNTSPQIYKVMKLAGMERLVHLDKVSKQTVKA